MTTKRPKIEGIVVELQQVGYPMGQGMSGLMRSGRLGALNKPITAGVGTVEWTQSKPRN